MTIHKEGRTLLFVLMVILVGINWAVSTYIVPGRFVENILIGTSLVLYLLILQFFRNPTIETPLAEDVVYAPADGKVVVIEETVEDEYFKKPMRQVSVFMSPINVHVNRNPISGIIKYCKYHPGKYLVAWHPKSSTENERTSIVIGKNSGVEILIRQVAGALARRIKWYVEEGQPVKQGEEFGFIKFGSRVDLYLPMDAEVVTKIGEITKGGKTILARLKQ